MFRNAPDGADKFVKFAGLTAYLDETIFVGIVSMFRTCVFMEIQPGVKWFTINIVYYIIIINQIYFLIQGGLS